MLSASGIVSASLRIEKGQVQPAVDVYRYSALKDLAVARSIQSLHGIERHIWMVLLSPVLEQLALSLRVVHGKTETLVESSKNARHVWLDTQAGINVVEASARDSQRYFVMALFNALHQTFLM